jgi:hypothetical protein
MHVHVSYKHIAVDENFIMLFFAISCILSLIQTLRKKISAYTPTQSTAYYHMKSVLHHFTN